MRELNLNDLKFNRVVILVYVFWWFIKLIWGRGRKQQVLGKLSGGFPEKNA